MSLRRCHPYSAMILVAYASVHIANHLVGLAGIEAHIAFMESFRTVYRIPVVGAVHGLARIFRPRIHAS